MEQKSRGGGLACNEMTILIIEMRFQLHLKFYIPPKQYLARQHYTKEYRALSMYSVYGI